MRINDMSEFSLLDLLIKKNVQKRATQSCLSRTVSRDSIEISSTAEEMLKTNKVAGTSNNRRIDQSIDLQSYVDEAKVANQSAVSNAGNEIKANNTGSYQDNYHAFRNALTDKYRKLADEAKSHSNPENYIEQKYFDKSCSWYATDLTDEERRIGFNYEKQMLETGTLKEGVKYKDSLFRGIEVSGDAVDAARIMFNRQMVNAQIGNILKSNGIEWTEDNKCTFSVDPYSYYISVEGVDEDTKERMESALNVGENGKNLYLHIKNCASQDGANSTQITEDGVLKYQAYHQVLDFTGLELDTLEEKSGSYYTKDGKDICDIVDAAIDDSKDVPDSYKQQMKDWIKQLVNRLSAKGWDNIRDMILEIDYSGDDLIDKYQDIFYTTDDAGLKKLLNSEKYITL